MSTEIKPLLFTFPHFESIGKNLLDSRSCEEGIFVIERFLNQEMHLLLESDVANQDAFILGTCAPPENLMIAFFLLADTLKKEKARKVFAVLPYLAYSRHEKKEAKQSRFTALLGNLIKASGVDEVITIDIHQKQIEALFPIPIRSLSPARFFAEKIKEIGLENASIVSPDAGALQRNQDVSDALKKQENVIVIKKKRAKDEIIRGPIENGLKEKIVMVDDILDTGSTLISAAEKLLEKGVKEITIMVTHGLFTCDKWKKLWDVGVKKIYCTDTVQVAKEVLEDKRVVLIPLAGPLIASAMKERLWSS